MAIDPVTLIAGVSGVLQAVQVWYAYRSDARSGRAFDDAYASAQESLQIKEEAQAIARIVPQEILDLISERTHRCWVRYREVFNGGYLPGEIDEATEALKGCICRELRRLIILGEPLPPGKLSEWWQEYCQ